MTGREAEFDVIHEASAGTSYIERPGAGRPPAEMSLADMRAVAAEIVRRRRVWIGKSHSYLAGAPQAMLPRWAGRD